MSPPITQKDIAKKLGVSVTLVSRVLGGKAGEIGAAAATVDSIRQAAAEMGYVPNATARILKGAPSRTLGVVVYDFEDPFLGALIGALQRRAHAHEHTLVLVGFEQRRVDAQSLMPLAKHAISGLIVVGSGSSDTWLDRFRARRVPLARIGTCPRSDHPSVAVDSANGIRLLLEHLRARGVQSAGFVGDTHPAHEERRACFAAAAATLGLETRAEWQVVRSEAGPAAGAAGARELLRLPETVRPRALVAASDAIAIGAMRVLQEHRIPVPASMAVTGFDDIPFADTLVPALTTIRQPVAELARTAFDWVSGVSPAPAGGADARVLLPGELVVRESA